MEMEDIFQDFFTLRPPPSPREPILLFVEEIYLFQFTQKPKYIPACRTIFLKFFNLPPPPPFVPFLLFWCENLSLSTHPKFQEKTQVLTRKDNFLRISKIYTPPPHPLETVPLFLRWKFIFFNLLKSPSVNIKEAIFSWFLKCTPSLPPNPF